MLSLKVIKTIPPEELPGKTVITKGNSKLGSQVHSFSLPAILTCPGRSGPCEHECYACRNQFLRDGVQDVYERNLGISRLPNFVDIMVAQLNRLRSHLFRWHVSGDVYNKTYARKILRVGKKCPHISFLLFSRSWRIDDICPILEDMSELPNVNVWYSCDHETGRPPHVPRYVRLAYMQTSFADTPFDGVGVVFRTEPLRGTVCKKIGTTQVCPAENGITKTTCSRCRICFRHPLRLHGGLDSYREIFDDAKRRTLEQESFTSS